MVVSLAGVSGVRVYINLVALEGHRQCVVGAVTVTTMVARMPSLYTKVFVTEFVVTLYNVRDPCAVFDVAGLLRQTELQWTGKVAAATGCSWPRYFLLPNVTLLT